LNDGPLPGAKRISSIAGILGHMAAQPSHGLGFGDNNDVFICECQRNLLSFNFMGVITRQAPTLVVDRPTGDLRLNDGPLPGAKRISSIAGISHGLGFGDNNDVFICECQRNLLSFNFMGVITKLQTNW
jgi:hypothetical protein